MVLRFSQWIFSSLAAGVVALWLIPKLWADWLMVHQPWDVADDVLAWFRSPALTFWVVAVAAASIGLLVIPSRSSRRRQGLIQRSFPIYAGVLGAVTMRLLDSSRPMTARETLTDPSLWPIAAGIVTALLVAAATRFQSYAKSRMAQDDQRYAEWRQSGNANPWKGHRWCSSAVEHECSPGWTPVSLLDEARSRPAWVRFWGTSFEHPKSFYPAPVGYPPVHLGRFSCPNATDIEPSKEETSSDPADAYRQMRLRRTVTTGSTIPVPRARLSQRR